jgi:hypothetical protein
MMVSGYYSRMAAIKQLIQQFLLSGGPSLDKQILSLGAGFDTTWFHLKVSPSFGIVVSLSPLPQKGRRTGTADLKFGYLVYSTVNLVIWCTVL